MGCRAKFIKIFRCVKGREINDELHTFDGIRDVFSSKP